ncbi:MAG TPA: choice-of-anchor B family protein [Ignavibacteria bacterium]|nr:choice-of-anchor B family protein [Ignavibacteria bacterium]
MKKLIPLLFLVFALTFKDAFPQLGNFNMYVLKNIDTRRVPPGPVTPPWHYSGIWGYVAPNGREYAIMGCVIGTQIVDITDSANIREVYFNPHTINFSNPNQGNLWRELKVYQNYLYVVSEADTSGIEIYDLSQLPDTVFFRGKFVLPNYRSSHTISQTGPYLYINGGNSSFGQGTVILDLTNPLAPVRKGSYNTEYVHDSRVINDTLYASNINTGKLMMFDVSNKDTLKQLGFFLTSPNPFTQNSAVTKDGKYIFTTDETTNPPGRLKIWNKQNLSNITFIRSWQPQGITNTIVHNIEIVGDTAYISHYNAGVRVLDITNPEEPVEIAWYDTYPGANGNTFAGAWGVYKFPSGKIVVSDMNTGMYVLKIGNTVNINNISSVAESFDLSQNYPNPFNPETTIEFSIPNGLNNESVNMSVYDLSGKLIKTLVNQNMSQGRYSVKFNGNDISSGIYFYKLTYGNFSETKRMMLVK